MSTLIWFFIGYGLFSLFCTAILLAACVIAGQAQQFRASSRFFRSERPSVVAEPVAKQPVEALPARNLGFPKRLADVV